MTTRRAFTLVEVLVVIAVIALIAAMLLPALSKARQSGRRTACASNLRQLSVAVSLYAGENEGDYPPVNQTNHWPAQLHRGYENFDVLLCPSDRTPPARDVGVRPDDAPRSYVMNLFRDHFASSLSAADIQRFNSGQFAGTINEGSVGVPSDTIVFGEKRTGVKDFYFDLAGIFSGREHAVLEQRRHMRTSRNGSGGSNYAFVDGSVRFLANGNAFHPVNLWGVTGFIRTNEEAPPARR
jgi:prepilin-type N-terminal cleavage/methylation domain-containing protein/prepilin-type processing-associated H-X9-DG protein